MVRHEAAEALGALGDRGSLEVLGQFRDRAGEEGVVRETCEIAVERIRWELEKRGEEVNVRKRCVHDFLAYSVFLREQRLAPQWERSLLILSCFR